MGDLTERFAEKPEAVIAILRDALYRIAGEDARGAGYFAKLALDGLTAARIAERGWSSPTASGSPPGALGEMNKEKS